MGIPYHIEATQRYAHLTRENLSWQNLLESIRAADSAWRSVTSGTQGVLGERGSLERTIRFGHDVVNKSDWTRLTELEADVLIGSPRRDPALNFLGDNTAAGWANHMFRSQETINIRQSILHNLKTLETTAPLQFPAKVEQILTELRKIDRIGTGVATRLIALARPDLALPLNSASKVRIAHLTGLAVNTISSPKNYRKVIEWIFDQPWHKAPVPTEYDEQNLWEIRTALFDCLLYSPRVTADQKGKRSRQRPRRQAAQGDTRVVSTDIAESVTGLLVAVTAELAIFLNRTFQEFAKGNWWRDLVIASLSQMEQQDLKREGVGSLMELDLSKLLRVMDSNWHVIGSRKNLTRENRNYLKEMQNIRNYWAHWRADGFSMDRAFRHLDTILRFVQAIDGSHIVLERISTTRDRVYEQLRIENR